MCYDIKTSIEAQLKRAKRTNTEQAVLEITENLLPFTDLPINHRSGFSHPEVLIYTQQSPDYPQVATWGLIPHWVSTEEQFKKLQNSTLNARIESIAEKPAFRDTVDAQRCILYIDGFFEHHHHQSNIIPFYISATNLKPLAIAAIFSEWRHPVTNGLHTTFSIVTTKGNEQMNKIHNNPKLAEARMPKILTESQEEVWLNSKTIFNDETISKLKNSTFNELLKTVTVGKLRGKTYKGDVPEVIEEVQYPELNPTLF